MSKLFKEDIYKWPKTYKKMFNITNYKRNANQNHDEVSLHTQ